MLKSKKNIFSSPYFPTGQKDNADSAAISGSEKSHWHGSPSLAGRATRTTVNEKRDACFNLFKPHSRAAPRLEGRASAAESGFLAASTTRVTVVSPFLSFPPPFLPYNRDDHSPTARSRFAPGAAVPLRAGAPARTHEQEAGGWHTREGGGAAAPTNESGTGGGGRR